MPEQDDRLPPGYYVPSQFGKDAILKDENVFSSKKKHFFFIIISNFSNVQSSLFYCQINLIMRAENTFLRNITILYAFYSKFSTSSDFKKTKILFRKTHQFF